MELKWLIDFIIDHGKDTVEEVIKEIARKQAQEREIKDMAQKLCALLNETDYVRIVIDKTGVKIIKKEV